MCVCFQVRSTSLGSCGWLREAERLIVASIWYSLCSDGYGASIWSERGPNTYSDAMHTWCPGYATAPTTARNNTYTHSERQVLFQFSYFVSSDSSMQCIKFAFVCETTFLNIYSGVQVNFKFYIMFYFNTS